jgi:two-component system, chemotaxis family, protein-glutamate methylesterase/glutaminase
MAGRDIVVMGASAGGLDGMVEVVRRLPENFPGSVFVVIHFPASVTSTLPTILARAGPLPARHARDGEPIRPGVIYVAPPDCHLTILDSRLRLSRGPRENGFRPAIDPLFRTAARSFGPRVVGVLFSGNLNDGTAGLLVIKQRGGVAIVQSPETALYTSMPQSALQHVAVDYVLPPGEMAACLSEMAGESVTVSEVPMGEPENTRSASDEAARADRETQPGIPSTMSCPECHGVLWEVNDSELVRFRCRVGHAYNEEGLLVHQAENLEAALWTALRALEEHAALGRRLGCRAQLRGNALSASKFTEQAMDAEHHAAVIRSVLESGIRTPDVSDTAAAAVAG